MIKDEWLPPLDYNYIFGNNKLRGDTLKTTCNPETETLVKAAEDLREFIITRVGLASNLWGPQSSSSTMKGYLHQLDRALHAFKERELEEIFAQKEEASRVAWAERRVASANLLEAKRRDGETFDQVMERWHNSIRPDRTVFKP